MQTLPVSQKHWIWATQLCPTLVNSPQDATDQVSHLYLKLEEFICMNVMGAYHSINSHEVYIIQLTTEATKWTTLEILVKKLWRVFVAFRQLKRFTSISLAESWALLLHRIRVAWSIAIKIGYVFLHHRKILLGYHMKILKCHHISELYFQTNPKHISYVNSE